MSANDAEAGDLGDRTTSREPLVGNHAGERSLRVGAYRIVYEVWEGKKQVIILTVKQRRHVY
ncbi:MAG: hypothetical protein NPIRA04_01670 [Nitrospirales bacterium]|nr:MAG: hypothetical protein NPIRA04_01670 [Nitrospirales bacterium]